MGRSTGPRWTHLDQEILLKSGSSAIECSNLLEKIRAWKAHDCS